MYKGVNYYMSYDAINKYNREHYEKIAVRVPKGKKAIIENLANLTGLSINALILSAVEEKYGVNLVTKAKPISQSVREEYLQSRLEFFEDVNCDRMTDILAYIKEKTDTIEDNQKYIEKVDILISRLIRAFYDKNLDAILDN